MPFKRLQQINGEMIIFLLFFRAKFTTNYFNILHRYLPLRFGWGGVMHIDISSPKENLKRGMGINRQKMPTIAFLTSAGLRLNLPSIENDYQQYTGCGILK